MKTESYANSQSVYLNETVLNDEFIGLINILSDSIKEFYKVSKNVNKNKNMLINLAEGEVNLSETFFNNNFKGEANNENIISFNNIIEKFRDIFNKLKLNVISGEKNLIFFFEDAKILFRKMKEKRQNLIFKLKKSANSTPKNHNSKIYSSSNYNTEIKNSQLKNTRYDNYTRSETNYKIKNLKNNVNNTNNYLTNTQDIEKRDRKSKTLNRNHDKEFNNTYNLNNFNGKTTPDKMSSFEMSNNEEMEKLKIINKRLTLELKKCKSIIFEKGNNILDNSLPKENNDYNKIIKDKNLKITELMNNLNIYNKEINKLKEENRKLREYQKNFNNNNVRNSENNLNIKNLIRENNILKNNIDELKKKNNTSRREFNSKSNLSNISLVKENESLKLKINKLNKDIISLKNRHQTELDHLSKTNLDLENNQNDLIIENYKKENEQLKETNNLYQDKIKYYQTKIMNTKNELFEEMKNTMELDNQNSIKKIKEEYENNISELNNKNKILENNLEECKTYNTNLYQQIFAKDSEILELNYKIEEMKKDIKIKEDENKKLLDKIEKMSKDVKNNGNQKEEMEKHILNGELSQLKKENELLKNKIINSEKKLNENEQNEIEILKNEIQNIKNENMSLKSSNEKLTNKLKSILDNNDGNGNISKDEIIKKQNEEIDGLKQLISKIQKEREKGDDEINTLKRENEKIKNQIIRLSKTLPEEYSELQKQYNELENKYLMKVKNGSLSASGKKNKNVDTNNIEEKLTKELQEARKEIEILKKKNAQLVEQLEEKEIKKNCYDNKSEDGYMSNYEEEFDLRKMAKGAREKNRSQDINIDYPGIQVIKEKYRELDFYYNSLEGLVKKLLLTISTTPKNKAYVTELCRIVGFDLETTNKILTNKNKKLLLALFTK